MNTNLNYIKDKIKLKVYDCTGSVTDVFEINWPAEYIDKFLTSFRIVIEGQKSVVCKPTDDWLHWM